MNFHHNDYSLSKIPLKKNQQLDEKVLRLYENNSFSKIIHRILDGLNISLLTLIFILSFLSVDSQRQWTNYYEILKEISNINNYLVDNVTITEEYYAEKLDSSNYLKKTTSKDIIYLKMAKEINKNNYFISNISKLIDGMKDSKFQRGF